MAAPSPGATEAALIIREAMAMRDEQLALAESAKERAEAARRSRYAHIAAANMIDALIGRIDTIELSTSGDPERDPIVRPASKALGARSKAAARPSVTVTFT